MSPDQGRARLRFDGVHRSFAGRPALSGLDLVLDEGQRVVVAGPNGAGKTTMLRLAAGLLRPTSGTVHIAGQDPTQAPARRAMAFVAHDAPLYAELRVREHLAWWARLHGAPVDATAWLERAGLARVGHERVHVLSRGQRQRLALAMALAPQPRLLLLDEPTTALDDAGRQWLRQELQDSAAAMLMATHEAGWAEALRADAVHLRAGALVSPRDRDRTGGIGAAGGRQAAADGAQGPGERP